MGEMKTSPPIWARLVRWLAEADVSLGDKRLDARWLQLAGSCHAGQGPSVAALAGKGNHADTRAAERFIDNERVEVSDLREGLYQLTLRTIRERQLSSLIVPFDPCELTFSTQTRKKGRHPVGTDEKTLGYTWLNAAAFDPRSQCFLGVLHQALCTDEGPDDQHELAYAPGVLEPDLVSLTARNFKQQLSVYASAIDERVDPAIELTFVADGDFDDGLTLRHLAGQLSARCHFVIRGDSQRVVQVAPCSWLPVRQQKPSDQHTLAQARDSDEWTSFYLRELLPEVPTQNGPSLRLDARGRVCGANASAARVANLEVGAVRIRLPKRSERGRRLHVREEPLELNLVVVRESFPPPGKKGVQWLLLTDLPVETLAQRLEVVERYLVRWRIEEFFRTTKDAMELEKSELQEPAPTARWLFFITLKAMVIEALRQDAGLQAGQPPTYDQRRLLRQGPEEAKREEQARQKNPKRALPSWEKRLWMVLGLIARYGQWTGNYRGSLGNYVLLRGLPFLLHDLEGGRYRWLVTEKDVWS